MYVCVCPRVRARVGTCVCACVRGRGFISRFFCAWVRACGCVRVCMCARGWGGVQRRPYFGAPARELDLYDTPRTQRDKPRTQRDKLFTTTPRVIPSPQTQWLFPFPQVPSHQVPSHQVTSLPATSPQVPSPQVTLLSVSYPQLSCCWLFPLVVLVGFLSPLLR